MEFSITKNLFNLSILEFSITLLIVTVIFYSFLINRTDLIVFFIVLCASFVGTTIPLIENIASFIRWLSIAFLLIASVGREKLIISPGFLLFWAYVGIGGVFLYRAVNLDWQWQRTILLVVVVFTIPFAFSSKKFDSVKSSMTAICIAGVVYCAVNFIILPAHLSEGSRFSGYSSSAAAFSLVLCGFLPFMLWGSFNANGFMIRYISGGGFVFGFITLLLSGQRTGTIAGLISIIPLLFLFFRQKKFVSFLLIFTFIFFLIGLVSLGDYFDKIDFLDRRYSQESGLSGRLDIWEKALHEIDKDPILGRGIGASENVIENSFHNAYLEVWYNSGILGLLLYLSAIGYFFVRVIFVMKRLQSKENNPIFKLAFGYMIGFILINIFESIGAGATNLNLFLFLFLGSIISNENVTLQRGDKAHFNV